MSPLAPAPHDLVWLTDAGRTRCAGELGAWASAAVLADMPLVVRRDVRRGDAIPVGLRGATRADRYAAWIPAMSIRRVVTPVELAARRAWRGRPELAALPAIRALEAIAGRLDESGLAWGIAGSAGFTLACSGAPAALHAGSDLDLVVRADAPLAGTQREALAGIVRDAPARVDIQVVTPAGGFALQELLRTGARVLLKTDAGPRMTNDPWQEAV